MSSRFYTDIALATGDSVTLPAQVARHVQVLRLQPGDHLTLFNGQAYGEVGGEGEFDAMVVQMSRSEVHVTVGAYRPTCREASRAVHLAIGMPANDRMDWLVEKATELGVASIQPLMVQRSVLRLQGERADKKRAHWRGVAIAACEQCGRNQVPVIHETVSLLDWLRALPSAANGDSCSVARFLLSPLADRRPFKQVIPAQRSLLFLSGPEGGLQPAEEVAAVNAGFSPVSLGARILRAETAPLACLAWLAVDDS